MSFLEEQYLRRVSYKLRNYKEKGGHQFNFSCPICGDSSKKKKKARCYAFDKTGSLVIHCHNCQYGASFPNFLKEIDPLLHQEFVMERFKEKAGRELSEVAHVENVADTRKYIPNIFDGLPRVSDLSEKNEAKLYATKRLLPLENFDAFYAERFIEWTLGHSEKFRSAAGSLDHSRIIFPFYARDGRTIGYTARALNGEEPKYYRIFVSETEKERFFGLDKLDETKQVYVLEGEIDSMFLPNAIAVSNGKLHTYMNKDAIYIPDADKRNPHIVRGIKDMIDLGLKVCLLPDGLPGKDINELVVAGFDTGKILDIIHANVCQGLSGKLKFNNWRVV